MAWPKSSVEVKQRLSVAMHPFPAELKPMFGCPAYFVNGNMFAGAFGETVFARFSGPDRLAALAQLEEITVFEPVAGRPMREYLALPEAIAADASALQGWLARSYAFASSLPVKAPGSRKARSRTR